MKKLLLAVLLTVMFMCLWAKHSDHFLIGDYPLFRTDTPAYDYSTICNDLDSFHQLGLNAAIIETGHYSQVTDLGNFNAIKNYADTKGIDIIPFDEYHNGNMYSGVAGTRLGLGAFTRANYWRFEAEEIGPETIRDQTLDQNYVLALCPSRFWYYLRNPGSADAGYCSTDVYLNPNIVTNSVDRPYSNSSALHCNGGGTGYLFKQLRLRRFKSDGQYCGLGDSGNGGTRDDHVVNKFVFSTTENIRPQKLYAAIGVIFDDHLNPLNNDTPILQLKLSFNTSKNDDGATYSPSLTCGSVTGQVINITKQMIMSAATDPGHVDIHQVEISCLFSDLLDNQCLTNAGWRLFLQNVNFELQYCGVGDVYIDYIDFYDDIFRKAKLEPNLIDTALNARAIDLGLSTDGSTNVPFLYTHDEPNPPQMEIIDWLKKPGSPLNSNTFGTTLIEAIQNNNFTANYLPGRWYPLDTADTSYNQYDVLKSAHPNTPVMCTDNYPISSNLRWGSTGHNSNELQNYTDEQLDSDSRPIPCKSDHVQLSMDLLTHFYRRTRTMYPDVKYFAVTQSYGNYSFDGSTYSWGMIVPPAKTLQAITYLPLCYGVNGIFNYSIRTNLPGTASNISSGPNNDMDFSNTRNNVVAYIKRW